MKETNLRECQLLNRLVQNKTDRTMRVTFSFGNWLMYMLAAGYDSFSRRVKWCGSSLNSRNFHCAKGVYRLPLMFDGFLWYS